MAVLHLDPVGVYRAQFIEVRPTKKEGSNFYTLVLRFEYATKLADDSDVPPESHLQSNDTVHIVSAMKPGRWYYLRMAGRYSAGNNGFPSRVNLKLLEAICEAPKAGQIEYLLQRELGGAST